MVKKKRPLRMELKKGDFRVTVFGSARIKKTSREYKEVYHLGKMLGGEGNRCGDRGWSRDDGGGE